MKSAAENNEVVVTAIKEYASLPGGLLPLLRAIQAALGYIPPEQVATIASGMGRSRAEVHGVISFYHDFHSQPRARTTIQLCRAEACQAMGSRTLAEYAKRRLGIDFGETTADGRFSLQAVYCLGNCACSPAIRIGNETYARVDNTRFDELLDEH